MPTTIAATTGVDGRFRLAGIGRDRIAELFVSAPTIATAQLYVLNRDGAGGRRDRHATRGCSNEAGRSTTPDEFEYAAAPTQPIEGVIRDKDTGRPIAGFQLHGMVYQAAQPIRQPGIEATTDAQGHYRLTGLSKGPAISAVPRAGPGFALPQGDRSGYRPDRPRWNP